MIELIKGDITKIQVDAIVNAANSSCLGGGGVDGAIHRAGGPQILNECINIINKIGRLEPGKAVLTTGGNLPAKFVIHTVGPVWVGGDFNEEKILAEAYENSLKLAENHHLQSIAFPNISTGVYHFPKEKAAKIAIKTVREFLKNSSTIKKVVFVCFDEENYKIYKELLSV